MDNIKSSYSLQEFPYFSSRSVGFSIEETPVDFRVKTIGLHPRTNKKSIPLRSAVGEFSIKSQQNCRLHFSSACHKMNTVVTLTYPLELRDSLDGRLIKKHLDSFFKALKRYYSHSIYLWVLEFQTNNNPHFHILTKIEEKDLKNFRTWVSETWFRIVGSNLLKHLRAGTNCELIRDNSKVAIYMSSYLKKAEQKQVPVNFKNVGRFWGGSRGVFDIKKLVVTIPDSTDYSAYKDIMRELKDLRKLHHHNLKMASKKTGIKYHLRSGGGFIVWGGASAYKCMHNDENQTSFKDFFKYCECFYPRV